MWHGTDVSSQDYGVAPKAGVRRGDNFYLLRGPHKGFVKVLLRATSYFGR